jgi:hypothetical protein
MLQCARVRWTNFQRTKRRKHLDFYHLLGLLRAKKKTHATRNHLYWRQAVSEDNDVLNRIAGSVTSICVYLCHRDPAVPSHPRRFHSFGIQVASSPFLNRTVPLTVPYWWASESLHHKLVQCQHGHMSKQNVIRTSTMSLFVCLMASC